MGICGGCETPMKQLCYRPPYSPVEGAARRTIMKTIKHLLLMVIALTLALTAAPAFADSDRHERFRDERRVERQWREHHEGERREREREEHGLREHRVFRFAFPAPYFASYCYALDGYWAWDGWQYVWTPPQTVCD
jgi:hypothetical protein